MWRTSITVFCGYKYTPALCIINTVSLAWSYRNQSHEDNYITVLVCTRATFLWTRFCRDSTEHRTTIKTHLPNTLTPHDSWIRLNLSYRGITAWWGHWSGPAWQLCKLSPAAMLFGLCKILMFSSLLQGNFENLILLGRPLVLLFREQIKGQLGHSQTFG